MSQRKIQISKQVVPPVPSIEELEKDLTIAEARLQEAHEPYKVALERVNAAKVALSQERNRQEILRMETLKSLIEETPTLVDLLVPTHQGSSCSDTNLHARTCARCFLIDGCQYGFNPLVKMHISVEES